MKRLNNKQLEICILQKKINQHFYDLHFHNYNQKTFNIDPEPFLSTLTNQLQAGSTVLDIGCGSGRDLLWMKKKGYKSTGFERSLNLASLARKNSGCTVIEGDFTTYDFFNLKFDALLLVGALVHIPYFEFAGVLIRISKALKSGGKMYITLKEGEGLLQKRDGRVDILWSSEHLERIFDDLDFAVLDYSRSISATDIRDIWLGYLLRFKENRIDNEYFNRRSG